MKKQKKLKRKRKMTPICPSCGSIKVTLGTKTGLCSRCHFMGAKSHFNHFAPSRTFPDGFPDDRPRDGFGLHHILPTPTDTDTD